MRNIKTFKLFESRNTKMVYRGIKRDYDKNYNDIQYYAENVNYAKVFGHKIKMFYLIYDDKDVMDLDKWNSKLSEKTRKYFGGEVFTVHSTYLNKNSEDYGYKGLKDYIYMDLGIKEFEKFNKEFINAKVIKGRDSGNESQIVYAVRDNKLIYDLS